MTEDAKVLSNEEVDTLSKAAEDKAQDLTELVGSAANNIRNERTLNHKALVNITELTWSECEKYLSSFLRKKVTVAAKTARLVQLSDALHGKEEQHVFSVFKIMPQHIYALAIIDMPFLHQAINSIFGGLADDSGPVIASPGKIGKIVAEHLCKTGMDGFAQACKEYGVITHEIVKTVHLPNLITKLGMEDSVYSIELAVYFGEIETSLTIAVGTDFLHEFIPANTDESTHVEKSSWRVAIESQVVDSDVTVSAALPEISIRASDLISLKSGDLLPIGDPTAVFLCLNETRLFMCKAAQANSMRVVKILDEM